MFFKKKQPPDYWQVLQPTWDRVDLHLSPSAFLHQLSREHPAAQLMYAAQWTFEEIANGAMPQYFHNSTGVLAPEAVRAFASLGFPDSASALADAMSMLGEPYPRDRAMRMTKLGPMSGKEGRDNPLLEPLLDLSEKFWDALGKRGKDFGVAMDAFAVKHGEEIRAHNAALPPAPRDGELECDTHGIQDSAMVCRHLLQAARANEIVPLGFTEPGGGDDDEEEEKDADYGHQAWCNACDEMLVAEGLQWTEKATAFSEPHLVCFKCFEEMRAVHASANDPSQ